MHRRTLEGELFANKRLLWLFTLRELRARYAGSFLGIFWSVIHPLIMLALYIIVFSTLVPRTGRLPFRSTTAEYTVFLCPALIAWNWFQESLLGATNSITANAAVIRKTVFPISILPAIPLTAGFVAFSVSLMAFLLFLSFLGHFAWIVLVWLILLALIQAALCIGPAYFLATINVFVRDTGQLIFAVFQILFWSTPVVYPPEAITKSFPAAQWWFRLNPMARLIDAYREVILLHRSPSLETLLYLMIWIIISYHAGRSAFMHGRKHFADEV